MLHLVRAFFVLGEISKDVAIESKHHLIRHLVDGSIRFFFCFSLCKVPDAIRGYHSLQALREE